MRVETGETFFSTTGDEVRPGPTAKYEAVVGLEVHTQLDTETKMFCGCPNRFGAEPNTLVCPVCLGLPGSLPKVNRKAFQFALRTAAALGCEIASFTKFDRKNYYYPDLPRNYQISQYDLPFARGGHLEIFLADGRTKTARLTRIHMEDDAGKLVHDEFDAGGAGVDLNRSGAPLLEIVGEPDLRSPAEARAFMEELAHVLAYLGVSDVNMQEGSLRCDANVSVRPVGQIALNPRREIKNMNSFRFVEQAVAREIRNQITVYENGGSVRQTTCLFDPQTGEIRPMRDKEDAHDYRYFPEPDLPPLTVSAEMIAQARAEVCELPRGRRKRYAEAFGLSDYDAGVLTAVKARAEIFERMTETGLRPKIVANWLTADLQSALNERGLAPEMCGVPAIEIAALIRLVEDGVINRATAKDKVWPEMLETRRPAAEIVKRCGYAQISDADTVAAVVDEIVSANPKQLADFKSGKTAVANWFFGQCMKKLGGQAKPDVVRAELLKRFDA
jgi:aspartyl-tRNA(Asn)/glutamyl-tRNA(Gln) amidotransferase subunit B